MAFVTFLGVRKDAFRVGRAALPKLFLEDVSAEVFDVVVAPPRRRCVCVSAMPRVMVQPFLAEYLGVDTVVAPEIRQFRGYYLGIMEDESEVLRAVDVGKLIAGDKGGDGGGGSNNDVVFGVAGLGSSFAQVFQKHCKDGYVPNESERQQWHALPWWRFPKPLIFHDGRIAFRPTPVAMVAMFMWLPLGAALAIVRMITFQVLPFSLSVPLLAGLGMHTRVIANHSSASKNLFACNHRSLLDPLYVAGATGRKGLAAATYGISRLSEVLSPMLTFRLTRDRTVDRAAMQEKLSCGRLGGLVVCPEGTTCREPYLQRFSPLFVELGHDVVPVALHSSVGMFHGTTAGGCKALDPLFLLMNPVPAYIVQFLATLKCGRDSGGGLEVSRAMANELQERIAKVLGYTCTDLTRKDKYLILTGN